MERYLAKPLVQLNINVIWTVMEEGFDFDMPEVQFDFGEADLEMDHYGDVEEEGEEEE